MDSIGRRCADRAAVVGDALDVVPIPVAVAVGAKLEHVVLVQCESSVCAGTGHGSSRFVEHVGDSVGAVDVPVLRLVDLFVEQVHFDVLVFGGPIVGRGRVVVADVVVDPLADLLAQCVFIGQSRGCPAVVSVALGLLSIVLTQPGCCEPQIRLCMSDTQVVVQRHTGQFDRRGHRHDVARASLLSHLPALPCVTVLKCLSRKFV